MATSAPAKPGSAQANPGTSAAATQSTKPGASGDPAVKPEKVKIVRVYHPAIEADKDGKAQKLLKEFPTDFNPKVHKPLRPKDFENEAPLLRRQADELEKRVTRLRKQAETVAKLGSLETRQKAKKLLHMREQLAKLEKEMKDQGIEVAETPAEESVA